MELCDKQKRLPGGEHSPVGSTLRGSFQTVEDQGLAKAAGATDLNYRGSKGIIDGFSKSFQMFSEPTMRTAIGILSNDT
jgi:hypothetical protein